MNYLIKKIWKYFKKIEMLGIYSGISYLDSRKIRMLNIIALACLPLTLYFSFTNWSEGRPLLSIINILNFITCFIVLILQYHRQHAQARFVLSMFNFLFFSLGGYFFNNGGQYLLLTVLIVVILAYDKRWIQISASTVIIAVMLLVAFAPSPIFREQYVTTDRIIANFITSIPFIVFIILFFKEIHYRYQDKIEEQHTKLKEMNNTMENIFSIIAHDIRSPLISVQDMLYLFQKDIITQQTTQENISTISNRIALLNTALDNLLQWGTRNIHGIKAYRQKVAISNVIQEVLHLLSPQANQKGILLKTEVDPDLNAYIDRDQIIVVLRNILSNAIKYSFLGEIILISAKEIQGKAIISIQDRGIGMTKEKLDQLFKNLQIPAIGTNGERGTGLGLLLSKELLGQNGGDFNIHSQPNNGSTFTISLPIAHHTQMRELAEL